jgi:hypothetical protein
VKPMTELCESEGSTLRSQCLDYVNPSQLGRCETGG